MKLYRIVTFLASPFLNLYLQKRRAGGKEDPERMSERMGHPGFPRPEGPLVWIHAASVGESLSILPLIQRITDYNPDLKILLTTGTTSSAKVVETRLPANAFHQYTPIDSILAVRRFLKNWKPDLALWVESEFWPNLLNETAKQCPIVLINARISNTSFSKWKRYKSIIHRLLQNFDLCMPQSREDSRRLKELGAPHIKDIGNLKYDAPALPSDSKKMSALLNMIEDRHMWMASSTHAGEEEIIADTHNKLKETYHDLLTILVPRHPKRGEEIAALLKEKGLTCALRSEDDEVTPTTDIYIANTIGELGIFYRLASIVFIGGSLIKHGGQNPLEAARLECAILAGPHMENFRDITREMEENTAIIRVKNKDELAEKVDIFIHDSEKQEDTIKAALGVAESKGEILNAYMEALSPYLDKISSAKQDVA